MSCELGHQMMLLSILISQDIPRSLLANLLLKDLKTGKFKSGKYTSRFIKLK